MKCKLCENDITAVVRSTFSVCDDEEKILSVVLHNAICKHCKLKYSTLGNKITFPATRLDSPNKITVFRDGLMVYQGEFKVIYSEDSGEFSVVKKKGNTWNEEARYSTSMKDMIAILKVAKKIMDMLQKDTEDLKTTLKKIEGAFGVVRVCGHS